jgi:hypothetical protein
MRVTARVAGVFFAVMLSGCSHESGIPPTPTYDETTGALRSVAYDANHSGRNNAVMYMSGKRPVRVEMDLDGNGQVERWEFYAPDGTRTKVGLSQRNDGVMDTEAHYTDATTLESLRISTKRDGRFDRNEYFDHNVLVRSDDDTNGDGRPDKWDTYQVLPGAAAGTSSIVSTAIDETGRGTPTRRLVFGPDGAVVRVEIDPDGDGVFTPVKAAAERGRGPAR